MHENCTYCNCSGRQERRYHACPWYEFLASVQRWARANKFSVVQAARVSLRLLSHFIHMRAHCTRHACSSNSARKWIDFVAWVSSETCLAAKLNMNELNMRFAMCYRRQTDLMNFLCSNGGENSHRLYSFPVSPLRLSISLCRRNAAEPKEINKRRHPVFEISIYEFFNF